MVIEQLCSDRQCKRCGKYKLETAFPMRYDRGAPRRRGVCRQCITQSESVRYTKRHRPSPHKAHDLTAVPLPSMDLNEQLACLRLRKWTGPVDRTRQLRGSIR